jgi:predicted Zn-dependent peptidase
MGLRVFWLGSILLATQIAANAAEVSLPGFERIELENGTTLILSEKHDVPLIGLEVLVRGGAVTDPQGKSGLASLLASVLQHGAGERDAAAFAEAIEAVGGELAASASLEGMHVSADFMSRDAALMIELVTDLLQRPLLDADEFTKLRDRSIDLIKAAKGGNLGRLLPYYGSAFLFGDHPYGNPVDGSETTLANITHEDLLGYYTDFVGGDRLIISVVGDFNLAAMKVRLTTAFGDWRPAAIPLPAVAPAVRNVGRRVLLIDKPGATQTYFWIGNIGVAAGYGNRAELNLANTVFGGRYTSMLNTSMRMEAGLTYGAHAVLRRYMQPGIVAISSDTGTDTTIDAIDMALDILDRLRKSGIEDEQALSARNYIMGQFPPRLETAAQLAGQFAVLEQYGLPTSYINDYGAALTRATVESIDRVIEEVYPSPDDLGFIIIGDAAVIREDIAQYGPVTEMSISEPRFR